MKPLSRNSILVSILIGFLIFSGISSVFIVPVQAVSTQSVDLSSIINCGDPTLLATCSISWWTYDSANNVAWASVGTCSDTCEDALYRVNLNTVLTSPSTSITQYLNILPHAVAPYGSVANGFAAGVMLNGYLWVTGWYSNNSISVSQVSSNGVLVNQFFYSGPGNARAITASGSNLIIGASGKILEMTQAGTFSVLTTVSGDVKDLKLSGSTLWFTQNGATGLGRVNTDGSGLEELSCSCSGGTFITLVGSNTWFTSNVDHTLIRYDGSSFTSFPTGLAGDGPYGLNYDSTRNGIWVLGFADKVSRFFNLATSSIDATKDVTSAKKPFMGINDKSNNIWIIAKGSSELAKINAPTSTTTTTSVITSASTSTTTSGTSTQTSVSTITTTLTFVTEATSTVDASGCPTGANCKPHPIVIPTIHLNKTTYVTNNGSVSIDGRAFFLIGPSSGFINALLGVLPQPLYDAVMYLSPSRGTFASLGAVSQGQAPVWYLSPPAAVPQTVGYSGESRFGWLCYDNTIVQTNPGCSSAGGGSPIEYRSFGLSINGLGKGISVVKIVADGTESGEQVSIQNVIVYNVGA